MAYTNREELIKAISSYAYNEPSIRGLGLIGSWARRDYGPRSDIDLVVLIDEQADMAGFMDKLIKEMPVDKREIVRPLTNKVILFVGDDLLKLDLFVVEDLADVEKYYQGSRIMDVGRSILVDKDGKLESAFGRWTYDPGNKDLVPIVVELTEKFLESFELASRYVYQSDTYRFYFNYNIALSFYASMVQLEKGDDAFLYTPRRLLDRMDIQKKNSMIKLVPSLIISEAYPKLEALGGEFCSIYQRLNPHYNGLQRSTADVRRFITAILDRDLVWNFRDVSWVSPDIIRHGQLFRSSVLARFQNLRAFDELIKRNGIKRIIDLRRPHEIAEYPYIIHNSIEVIAIPMELRHGNSCLGGFTGHLHSDLLDNPTVIQKCFSLLSEGIPTVIHCHTGKDRTGVIIALVLLAAGVPEGDVKRDFMASGLDLKESDAELLFDRIRELGGANGTLRKLGVSEEIIKKVKMTISGVDRAFGDF